MGETTHDVDSRLVFVVHGRNESARDEVFTFLRSLDLKPMVWESAVALTEKGSPYIGEVLDVAFERAQAIVVLLTPDEVTYLHGDYATHDDPDAEPAFQARPNVLFEAGLAFGRNSDRTLLVEFGAVRPFSDIAGRHLIRLDNSPEARNTLKQRLKTAGCTVDDQDIGWQTAGNLEPPRPTLDRDSFEVSVEVGSAAEPKFDADYRNRGGSKGNLTITNTNDFDVFEVVVKSPDTVSRSFNVLNDEPIKRLPTGKTATFKTWHTGGLNSRQFDLIVLGHLENGEPFEASAYVDLSSG